MSCKVIPNVIIVSLVYNVKNVAVGPHGWNTLFESPDSLARLTKTTIFTNESQTDKWASELKAILLARTGRSLGSMTTCFFSNCCGYEYSKFRVQPSKIPPVLFEMMAALMPVCGITNKDCWPTGINVNFYPDG
jgi:hypothetical protein